MKGKNMIILVGILAVLVIIYLVQNMSSDKVSISESLLDLYPDLNSSSVVKIRVFKQGYADSGLAFSKQEGNWVADSYYSAPVKSSEIEKLFTDIRNLQGEIRSTKKELFADYDIQEEKALQVELLGTDSTGIAHLLFGKGVPQASRSCFLRNYGQDTVYLGNENFISRFAAWNAEPYKRLPADRWIEMKLADFDKDAPNKIELKAGKKSYLFEKQQQTVTEDTVETTRDVWVQVQPAGDKLDENKIGGIVSRIGALRGMEIVAGEVTDEHELANASHVASVTLPDGSVHSFEFGAEADTTANSRFVKVADKPHVYTVAKFNYEAIFINPFKDE